MHNLTLIARGEVAVSPSMDRTVTFVAKKDGTTATLTAEGAVYKGGKALKALRTVAAEVALGKAINGRYRSASEIVANGAPASLTTSFNKLLGSPWNTKASFTAYCEAVLRETPKADKGWNEKQLEARDLAQVFIDFIREQEEKAAEREADTVENGYAGTPLMHLEQQVG